MKLVALAAVVAVPAAAAAGPMRDVVVHGPRHAPPGSAAAFAPVSHTLYMNDCLPAGCDVQPGWEDSRSDRSSIPQAPSHLDAYGWGDAHWADLVQCVRDTFAPFDIDVVTDDPGTADHFEVMVGGYDYQVQIDGALGVAPFIPCDGDLVDNVMTFVFAAETSNIDQLCWAVAQEASHAWGLDHELDAKDPMTYLYPPFHKVFQDSAARCGEAEASPRTCWCGEATQNSYQYLMDTFGPAEPRPPAVTITAPPDGAWVTPGFAVHASLDSQLSAASYDLAADGAVVASASADDAVFATPASLAGGDHTLTVTATDLVGQTATAQIAVHVTATCGDGEGCADDFACLGGNCLPTAVAGGLGQACTDDPQCITGECWTGGDVRLCSQACDPDRRCPDGFECIGDGAGACWPAPGGGGGGCAAGGGSGGLAFGLTGLLVLGARVRRRR